MRYRLDPPEEPPPAPYRAPTGPSEGEGNSSEIASARSITVPECGAGREIVADQQAEAAWQNVEHDECLPREKSLLRWPGR